MKKNEILVLERSNCDQKNLRVNVEKLSTD